MSSYITITVWYSHKWTNRGREIKVEVKLEKLKIQCFNNVFSCKFRVKGRKGRKHHIILEQFYDIRLILMGKSKIPPSLPSPSNLPPRPPSDSWDPCLGTKIPTRNMLQGSSLSSIEQIKRCFNNNFPCLC